MACLLAIDTTTDVCSVALQHESETSGSGFLEHTRLLPRLHNRHVLAMIDGLFRAAAIARRDIDFVAFSAGPGSFTGVRIGAAIAQGIAFAANAQAIPVASSAVCAESARQAGMRGTFAVCRDSRPGWHYQARYRITARAISMLEFDTLQADANTPCRDAIDGKGLAVTARTVARLALRTLEQAVPPALALPLYVAGDTPWRANA